MGDTPANAMTRQEFDQMLGDESLDLDPTARMILLAYATHMNYKDRPGTAYKSQKDAGIFAGVNEVTARRYIHALIEDGFLIDSGERAPVSKFKPLVKYYLGRGTVTQQRLKRRVAYNKAISDSQRDSVTEATNVTVAPNYRDSSTELPLQEHRTNVTLSRKTTSKQPSKQPVEEPDSADALDNGSTSITEDESAVDRTSIAPSEADVPYDSNPVAPATVTVSRQYEYEMEVPKEADWPGEAERHGVSFSYGQYISLGDKPRKAFILALKKNERQYLT